MAQDRLDPVLLEILSHKVRAATEEMAITLHRTARTTYVKEASDFGTALATPEGKFFGYPESIGVAGFIDLDCGATIRAVPDLEPGDVIVTNHPYRSGGLATHMPDLQLLEPYFHDGEILCFGWVFIHSADIGGGVPSSISPGFHDLFQEGLQIPPMRLYRGGRMSADFVTLYAANCRVPEPNLGDIRSMRAALEVGRRRVAAIVAQHGADAVRRCRTDLPAYAAAKALAVQRAVPDGTYTFWDYMDDDFVSRVPIRLRLELTVRDGHLHFDYAGTDPQVPSAYNVPTGGVRHPWLTMTAMKLIATRDRSAPLNHGLFEHMTVSVPPGTVANPEFPAAVGVRHATAIRINETILGCLHRAVPGAMPAPAGGTVVPVVLAERDPASGARKVMVLETLVGGTGARAGADGIDGRDSGLANLANTPTEKNEEDAAIRVEAYGLRPDSGGPGKWRGGTGLIYAFRVLQDGSEILGRGLERFVFRPWGVAGGGPGAAARVILDAGTAEARELGKIDLFRPRRGDVVTVMTAGGGGFGNPYERPVDAVLADVDAGFVTPEAATRDYGVCLRDGSLDAAATERLRRDRAPTRAGLDFDGGPERRAWESVFDDAAMERLNRALMAVPASIRAEARRAAFEAVAPGLAAVPRLPLDRVIDDAAAQRSRLDAEIARIEARAAAGR